MIVAAHRTRVSYMLSAAALAVAMAVAGSVMPTDANAAGPEIRASLSTIGALSIGQESATIPLGRHRDLHVRATALRGRDYGELRTYDVVLDSHIWGVKAGLLVGGRCVGTGVSFRHVIPIVGCRLSQSLSHRWSVEALVEEELVSRTAATVSIDYHIAPHLVVSAGGRYSSAGGSRALDAVGGVGVTF